MTDPWYFGWTQLFTLIGLLMTGAISFVGLRTFEKWRREKLEERRIETAIEALSLAYKSKYVFDYIRSTAVFDYEWDEIPEHPGEPKDRRASRGRYFAVLKRIEKSQDFFNSVWAIQPRVMALFGEGTERTFLKLHEARRQIEVSAGMLMQSVTRDAGLQLTEDLRKLREQQLNDIDSALEAFSGDSARVGDKLTAFRTEMQQLCRPIVERSYRK